MASSFSFYEDNGAGPTRTLGRTGCNWKNFDSSTDSDYATYPVTAGNCSFKKYQGGGISGTWNQVSNGKFGHTAGTLGSNISLYVRVASGYVVPNTGDITASGGYVNITTPSGIATAYQTIYFSSSPTGVPQGSITSAEANPTYTCYWITQVQTTTGASPGDSATATLTFQYDES